MSSTEPAGITDRRSRGAVVAAIAIAVAAALAGVFGLFGNPWSTASADVSKDAPTAPHTVTASPRGEEPQSPPAPPPAEGAEALPEDGGVGAGTTVFDDEVPAIARLEPRLLDALTRAATDAATGGVAFTVNSGWRSARYQDRLLREAVAEYGSAEEAARWVAAPETSTHVRGEAVDMAPDAAAWLSAHGAGYGLCQIYVNESWHFELRPAAVERGCPEMYPDPTYDPRMN
ncbi:MAG TPA: M15 family metallopeptidase [Microbacterium sp.]|nr:M15 family metallopeptidase [Microbacterium sp.]